MVIYDFLLYVLNATRIVIMQSKVNNTPTGASTNPKIFDLNKNLNMNLI